MYLKFGGWTLKGRSALQSSQQFRERNLQGGSDLAQGSQPRLTGAALQIGDVDLVDAGLLGKVDLSPAFGAAQLSDALARRHTEVFCHAFIIGLAFALYLAHTLFGTRKVENMRLHSVMRSSAATLLLVFSVGAFAKDKPRITIEVVKTEMKTSEYTYTTPGRQGTAQTNCATNGTTNGTISDYGIGPIQTHSTDNASTNCTTTTTAATPPQTHVASATHEAVTAIMPDGSSVMLFCEYGRHRCDYLAPGNYTAEIDHNALQVYVPDLSGKVRKVKYDAVIIERTAAAQPQQPLSTSVAPPPSAQPSTNTESAPSTESLATLKEQAASGDANAQWNLYLKYENEDGVLHDEVQAIVWLRKAAELGYIPAQVELGSSYQLGENVPQDYKQAAFWFRKAAEQGDADAQSFLGDLYAYGYGVTQNIGQAVFWYRKAAEQGDANSQEELAELYSFGRGVPQSDAQAAFWYRRAAELGNDKAQFYLGKAYETGKGVPQDYTQDAIWFRKAAEQGLADAQAELGGDYALGQGVPQDNSEAYFWLNLAAAGTPATVKPEEMAALRNYVTQARDDEASLLTPEARIRVQVRVRQWLEDHPTKPQ